MTADDTPPPEIPVVTLGSSGPLPAPVAAHAAGRFAETGVLVLKDLLPATRIASLHAAYVESYGGIDHRTEDVRVKSVGDRRQMISLDVAGAFAETDIFANPAALSIVGELLGDDFILGSYVAVTSMAGAKQQRLHADQEGLFGISDLDSSVPPYSITLVIPLVGLNPVTGSTRFFPGTHRDPDAESTPDGIAPDLAPGDAILFDSRISHGGMANKSDAPRPIVYCTYHRSWYRDVSNFRDMPAMIVPEDTLATFDDDTAALIDWVLTEDGQG